MLRRLTSKITIIVAATFVSYLGPDSWAQDLQRTDTWSTVSMTYRSDFLCESETWGLTLVLPGQGVWSGTHADSLVRRVPLDVMERVQRLAEFHMTHNGLLVVTGDRRDYLDSGTIVIKKGPTADVRVLRPADVFDKNIETHKLNVFEPEGIRVGDLFSTDGGDTWRRPPYPEGVNDWTSVAYDGAGTFYARGDTTWYTLGPTAEQWARTTMFPPRTGHVMFIPNGGIVAIREQWDLFTNAFFRDRAATEWTEIVSGYRSDGKLVPLVTRSVSIPEPHWLDSGLLAFVRDSGVVFVTDGRSVRTWSLPPATFNRSLTVRSTGRGRLLAMTRDSEGIDLLQLFRYSDSTFVDIPDSPFGRVNTVFLRDDEILDYGYLETHTYRRYNGIQWLPTIRLFDEEGQLELADDFTALVHHGDTVIAERHSGYHVRLLPDGSATSYRYRQTTDTDSMRMLTRNRYIVPTANGDILLGRPTVLPHSQPIDTFTTAAAWTDVRRLYLASTSLTVSSDSGRTQTPVTVPTSLWGRGAYASDIHDHNGRLFVSIRGHVNRVASAVTDTTLGGLIVSTNNGQTWASVLPPNTATWVESFVVHGQSADTILAWITTMVKDSIEGTSVSYFQHDNWYLVRTTNGGQSWDTVDTEYHVEQVFRAHRRSVVLQPGTGLVLRISPNGITRSNNLGQTWTDVAVESDNDMYDAVIDKSGRLWYMTSTAVYLDTSNVTSTVNDETVTWFSSLHLDVAPNPVTDATTITVRCSPSWSGRTANIRVVDIQGREVHNVTNTVDHEGLVTSSVNVAHLAHGAYYVHARIGNNHCSGMMIVK